MKFALFSEIPVAKPWDKNSEYRAYKDNVEQAVLAEQAGFHSFWSVEHHFLDEFSHCSNPEILYAHIAARTTKLRLGYGVRLMPKPYNHPIRTAESVAVQDLLSDGRVELGTGRSATRAELEGFGVDPADTRSMWQEAIEIVVGAWTQDEFEHEGKHWSLPKRRVLPKPLQDPHPPIWGATTSLEGHRMMGRLGLGLCSFSVGVPPEDLKEKVDQYRLGQSECTDPIPKVVNNRAATFTMVHCADTNEKAFADAEESMVWYPNVGARQIASVADWMKGKDLGSYSYAADVAEMRDSGALDAISFDYIKESGAAMVGDPKRCIEIGERYAASGCDMLFCLVNPYKIGHKEVMRSIELLGEHVIPALDKSRERTQWRIGRGSESCIARPIARRRGSSAATSQVARCSSSPRPGESLASRARPLSRFFATATTASWSHRITAGRGIPRGGSISRRI
jgi:alkanesulfonate monooxygenase SsuD/methylene tetrahydromethanopterin reductase-like flavin-dependent oxidoreductase (luciferase family)